jgi:bacterioferritin-associated ferredoxin
MIVCVCKNVSDRKIRQAVDAGMNTMVELREHLEIGTCCGKCHPSAKRLLRDCLDAAAPTQSQPLPNESHVQPIVFFSNALAA